ncbi:MAG: antibiotic biosynthesis monooxygenase [Chloroflexi bacterium]|nr:antibiotic biosynthesis monooxygenase [Chloroflexota bacterium]
MFVAINKLQVPSEYAARLEEGFSRQAGGMQGVDGFVSFDLLRAEAGGEYLVVTHWRDKAAFETWREGDAFQRAHASTNPNSPVTSSLGAYDVVLSRP